MSKKLSNEKPRNLWKDVTSSEYEVKTIRILILSLLNYILNHIIYFKSIKSQLPSQKRQMKM